MVDGGRRMQVVDTVVMKDEGGRDGLETPADGRQNGGVRQARLIRDS